MAPVSFYDISIVSYTKALGVLLRILQVAAKHPDVATFIESRLAPDMFPLRLQVRIATRSPVRLAEALAGKKLVPWNEARTNWGQMETSWPELIARVEKTLEILAQFGPDEVESKADEITLPMQVGPEEDGADAFRQVAAAEFTMATGMPETLFHVFITYAILRSKGVDLGKKDILIPLLPDYVLKNHPGAQVV
ncbi:hypothetical protein BJX63DRAFT_436078 [Aspergillus granulosus]|uniref:Uncharacterized protein n=1 Tax=Aspergillus granulosus TaxID=176169 RepID=A0ABR4H0Y0_9EURO